MRSVYLISGTIQFMMESDEKNPHRCTSVFNPTEGQRYRCMLPEDHEKEHMWFITWHPEHEGDLLQ